MAAQGTSPNKNSGTLMQGVTPSDTTFVGVYKGQPMLYLLVGGAGTVVGIDAQNNTVTVTAVAGQQIPMQFMIVKAASTATGLVAIY